VEYDVFIHVDLSEGMPKTGIQRRRIMEFIHGLRDDPHTPGDFTDKDASLRTREVKIVAENPRLARGTPEQLNHIEISPFGLHRLDAAPGA
jgi:hypothetical protein